MVGPGRAAANTWSLRDGRIREGMQRLVMCEQRGEREMRETSRSSDFNHRLESAECIRYNE
jgi:hypothetical protein